MLGRLESVLEASRTWLPSSRKRQSVYQQWTPNNSSELRNLTAATTKSDIDIGTEYQPHELGSSVLSFEGAKKTRVQKILGDRFTGWRVGALHFAAWAVVVFLINLTVTIWGSTVRQSGILFEGDCNRVEYLNTGLHVLINVLSTVLLSGSNYCMQCLSAPTRSEVDKAHAKGKWLDIGIPSIRNIRYLSWQRIILWTLLALTSLPLHLFYNSAVFGSVSSNDYFAFSVSKSFLEDTECRNCDTPVNPQMQYAYTYYPGNSSRGYVADDVPRVLRTLYADYKAQALETLTPAECITQYATSMQSKRRHLLLVAGNDNFPTAAENIFINGSNVYWAGPFYASDARTSGSASDSYNWMCSASHMFNGLCSNKIDNVRKNSAAWRVGFYCPRAEVCAERSFPVEYCLSQPAEPHCKLQYDLIIAVAVTILNFVKAVLMFFIVFRVRDEPLITMGDAVASFLENSDSTTKDMCLLSIQDVRNKGYQTGPREWVNQRFRWKDVASKKRRGTTLAIFLSTLAVILYLLIWGISSLPDGTSRSIAGLSRLGYGTVDPRTAITGLKNDLVMNALVANSPQVILSMLYFSYNALFTSFLLSYEWTTYAHKRKGLRVSHDPIGAQRTEYFLQLPYRFSIPLMMLSGILHWLVSQSIFLVAIDFYDGFGAPSPSDMGLSRLANNMKTCGFSPMAIISVLILGFLMVFAIIAFGFVPYKQGITLAGNCSMALSAACHPDKGLENGASAATEKLCWGVVGVSEDGVGHCSFSTKEVTSPIQGQVYAGTSSVRLRT